MARQPQVTRTIQTTEASVLYVNTVEGNTFVKSVVLPRTYKDNKAILKVLAQMNTDDTMKPVHVISVHVQETLYGMPESKFIELAEELPPRGSKVDNDED